MSVKKLTALGASLQKGACDGKTLNGCSPGSDEGPGSHKH